MKAILRKTTAAALVLLAGSACADLEVVNPNDPDAGRALQTADDVESLIAGSLNSWFQDLNDLSGPGMFLSSQSFQHSSTPANFAMLHYSAIPRAPVANNTAAGDAYFYMAETWDNSYSALAAVRDGFLAIDNTEGIAEELGALRVTRARAFGRFVQGIAHASLALLYDRAYIVDETVNTAEASSLEPAGYNEVMAKALAYFDEAIALSTGAEFEIPANWIYQTTTTADELVEVAHSYKALFRAAVARTPEERAAVDWDAVLADIDAGVEDGWLISFDWDQGWWHGVAEYGSRDGWSQMNYFILGMADQSGHYQEWLDTPFSERHPDLSASDPFLIITPDERFPQGTTLAEQKANPGALWMVPCTLEEGKEQGIVDAEAGESDLRPGDPCYGNFGVGNMWQRPARGTWRWSYYWSQEFGNYITGLGENPKEFYAIDPTDIRLLKAEALYRKGEPGVAELVDVTRVAAGLDPISDGSNDSCVPKLPDGTCGDLFEALKWEKRVEVRFKGLMGAPWYFDSRGWGDLYYGTQLQFPIPCQDAQVLGILPCDIFGGVGGTFSAPVSSYAFPGEG